MRTVLSKEQWQEVRQLFDRLSDLPPTEWQATLQAIDPPAEIAGEVAALLESSRRATRDSVRLFTSMLDQATRPEYAPGDLLGPWRLCERLGEGGMATVFRAVRADGVYTQTVAIKLLRGMGGKASAERLQAERQMLAGLGLRNVSRLLDGGTTPAGDPYIVMEYITGEHLDDYCRRMALEIPARVALFLRVCEVVRRAHEQFVVHCDLKHENILVTPEGEPVLLDFGIAHALRNQEDVRYSPAFTPNYAAPELICGAAVTAATDVYSLGIVLFELLADRDVDGMASSPDGARPVLSDWTRRENAWHRKLTGDLDAITARASDPDPRARYQSVQALTNDLYRWQDRRPVLARKGGRGYRFTRWLRREWQGVVVAAFFVLVSSIYVYNLSLARKKAEVEGKTAREVSNYLVTMFATTDPRQRGADAEKPLTARQLLDAARQRVDLELKDNPAQRARMQAALGQAYQNLGVSGSAIDLLQGAVDNLENRAVLPPAELANLYAVLALELGNNMDGKAGIAAAQTGLALIGEGGEPLLRARLLYARGLSETTTQSFKEADATLSAALSALAQESGAEASELRLSIRRDQALLSVRWGKLRDAEARYKQTLATLPPSRKSDIHGIETSLAGVYRMQGRYAEARHLLERGLVSATALYGADSRFVTAQYEALADLYVEMGDFPMASAAFETLLARIRPVQGAKSLRYSMALFNFADLKAMRKDFAGAEPMFREALRIRQVQLGRNAPVTLRAEMGLADLLIRRGRYAEAGPLLAEAAGGLKAKLPSGAPALLEVEIAQALYARSQSKGGAPDPLAHIALASVEDRRLNFVLRNLRLEAYSAQGDLPAARALAEDSVALLEGTAPAESAGLAQWRANLAALCLKTGDRARARALLAQAVPILMRAWVPGPEFDAVRQMQASLM